MHKIRYRITTLSPALFVMNVGDTNMVATREYIPGSVVMGLFAGEFIRKNPSIVMPIRMMPFTGGFCKVM